MFSQRPPREQYALLGLGAIFLLGLSVIGANALRQPAPIAISSISDPTPVNLHPAMQVHVVGAVKKPQVVKLESEARVQDAIRAAGGPTASADLQAINLAEILKDGDKVIVPSKTSERPFALPSGSIPSELAGRNISVTRSGSTARTVASGRKPKATKKPAPAFQLVDPEGQAYTNRLSAGETSASGPGSEREPEPEPSPEPQTEPQTVIRSRAETDSQVVHLNRATLEELDRLPGIGPKMAQRILDYRRTHGQFRHVDELLGIPNFGPKRLANLRKRISL